MTFDTNCDSVNVLNLSDYQLSVSELSVLERGLSFVPSPTKIFRSHITTAADQLTRNVKLEHYFRNSTNHTKEMFVQKSSFNPNESCFPRNIRDFCNETYNLAKTCKLSTPKDNLSEAERKALSSLTNNNSIIIRKADKGSTTVLLNKADYVSEALHQINNSKFYERLDPSVRLDTKKLIQTQLYSLRRKGFISQKQLKFLQLSTSSVQKRTFYTLPKIHKDRKTWLSENIPPGRPIVSDVGSPTYQIGKFISHQLKELSQTHPSYVKDSYHFLDKIRRLNVPPNAALVTLDVSSLYTNIDTSMGLQMVKEAMTQNKDPKRPDHEILSLLETCLNHNTFVFNDNEYIQKNGAAMGHSYCVEYANIVMAMWEQKALAKARNSGFAPLHYSRFIDDIFLIWPGNKESFLSFFNILNTFCPCIKLTYSFDLNTVNFLDITVYKGSNFINTGKLDTNVFFKPTDSHLLLHKHSYHPRHIFKSVVKSQVLRFRRICSNDEEFNFNCSILFSALKKRHYSARFLRRIKHEVVNPQGNAGNFGASPCLGPRCQKCHFLPQTSSVTINNFTLYIKTKLDCNSQAILYIITCLRCNLHYVGESKNMFRTRCTQHLSDIRHSRPTDIATHFRSPNHDISTDFRMVPIQQIDNNKCRRQREAFLIKKLNTTVPFGLNKRLDDLSQQNSILPIVVPYSHSASNFCTKAKALASKQKSTDRRIITAFRRHKNLSNFLVRKQLT